MSVTLNSSELYNQYFDQFRVTGLPHGIDMGTFLLRGVAFSLSSAQLLALNTTPLIVIPAPVTGLGISVPVNGFAYYPLHMSAEYIYNSTAYTLTGTPTFQLVYHGKTTSTLTMACTGLVDQTADTFALANCVSDTNFAVANASNLSLDITLAGTSPALTLGNGTVNFFLNYTIIPLS